MENIRVGLCEWDISSGLASAEFPLFEDEIITLADGCPLEVDSGGADDPF